MNSCCLFISLDQLAGDRLDQFQFISRRIKTCAPSLYPAASGSPLGVPALRRGPLHLPVAGRHRWEAGQAHQQQLSTGGAVRPRLRLPLHRCVDQPVDGAPCCPHSSAKSEISNWPLGLLVWSPQCSWCWEPV